MPFDAILGWVIIFVQLFFTLFATIGILMIVTSFFNKDRDANGEDIVSGLIFIAIFLILGLIISWQPNKGTAAFVFAYTKLNDWSNALISYVQSIGKG